jgi:hypothetical protein
MRMLVRLERAKLRDAGAVSALHALFLAASDDGQVLTWDELEAVLRGSLGVTKSEVAQYQARQFVNDRQGYVWEFLGLPWKCTRWRARLRCSWKEVTFNAVPSMSPWVLQGELMSVLRQCLYYHVAGAPLGPALLQLLRRAPARSCPHWP